MTERWRKKLEGIDHVDPSDDVYQRAKSGPNLPEPRSPMQRTSTRVVTAIAAFVVFALGISLFAIPALRLGGNDDFLSAGNQIQPLWPWNSIDAVQAWRDDPQPIGTASVDHFSSPDEVATAFGRDVLGWTEVWTHDEGTPQTYLCANGMPWGVGTSPSPTAPGDLCSVVYPSASVPPTLVPYAPTTAPPAFRTFDLSTCPPNAACDYVVGPPNVSVVVYQPLGSDGPWAVLEARTQYVGLSLAAGTPLRDGSTVYASGYIPRGAQAVLGFYATSGGCGATGSITGFEETPNEAGSDPAHSLSLSEGTYSRGQLGIGLAPVDASCQHQAGYVFVAITSDDLGTGDPVGGIRSDVGVVGFAAVPVSFAFPTSSGAPPTDLTTPTTVEWTTYTDKVGWSIDVPTTWDTLRLEGSDAKGDYNGAAFGSAPLEQYPGGPTTVGAPPGEVSLLLYRSVCTVCQGPGPRDTKNDTRFPLTIEDMDPVDGGFLLAFRADGLEFTLSIRVGGDSPMPEQMSILDRMVSSIAFQPWHPGDERNGWTALSPTTNDNRADQEARISWQTCDPRGCYVLVYEGDAPYVLGPIETCGEGENMTADATSPYPIVLECPNDPTQSWSYTGSPSPGNRPGDDVPLDGHPVIRAWDGTLLADLQARI
jgi:hypothetical protein